MQDKKTQWPRSVAAGLLALALPLAAASAFARDHEHDGAGDGGTAKSEHCAPGAAGHGPMGREMGGGMRGGMRDGMRSGIGEHLPPYLRGITLSEAQRDQLFELQHARMPQQRAQMKLLRQNRQALHGLSGADSFDAAKARSLADAGAKIVSDIAFSHAEFDAKVRALLTPEQRRESDARRARFESEGHMPHDHQPS